VLWCPGKSAREHKSDVVMCKRAPIGPALGTTFLKLVRTDGGTNRGARAKTAVDVRNGADDELRRRLKT
jgi:hypothetical protein